MFDLLTYFRSEVSAAVVPQHMWTLSEISIHTFSIKCIAVLLLAKVSKVTKHTVLHIYADSSQSWEDSLIRHSVCALFCVVLCRSPYSFVFTSHPADHITSVPLTWPESPTTNGNIDGE